MIKTVYYCTSFSLHVKKCLSFYFLRLQKIIKDLNRQLQSQGTGPWPANRVGSLERSVGELSRILESKVQYMQCLLKVATMGDKSS